MHVRHIFTLLSLSAVMSRVPLISKVNALIPPSPANVPGSDFVLVN